MSLFVVYTRGIYIFILISHKGSMWGFVWSFGHNLNFRQKIPVEQKFPIELMKINFQFACFKLLPQ